MISRSNLGTKPFAELSLMELGFFCQLLRGRPANVGECGVNSKPVAKYDQRSI
jgi:hypothetical protein